MTNLTSTAYLCWFSHCTHFAHFLCTSVFRDNLQKWPLFIHFSNLIYQVFLVTHTLGTRCLNNYIQSSVSLWWCWSTFFHCGHRGLGGRILIFLENSFPLHSYILSVWTTSAAEDSILGKSFIHLFVAENVSYSGSFYFYLLISVSCIIFYILWDKLGTMRFLLN